MPVVYDRYLDGTRLILWHITETEEELSRMVNKEDLSSAERFASPKRRCERLASRAALRTVIQKGTVEYDFAGAPYIPGNNTHINISHTDSMCAVAFSEKICAVDIEHSQRHFAKVAEKYISEAEKEIADLLGEDAYGIIWCAKEALYKYSGQKGFEMLKFLQVTGITKREDNGNLILSGNIKDKAVDEIRIIREGDYIIALI